jgi:hypothetical protein
LTRCAVFACRGYAASAIPFALLRELLLPTFFASPAAPGSPRRMGNALLLAATFVVELLDSLVVDRAITCALGARTRRYVGISHRWARSHSSWVWNRHCVSIMSVGV